MPSEEAQSKLPQPWKEWITELNPIGRQDICEGTFLRAAGDSDHRLVAVSPRVDVNLFKDIPVNQANAK
jgi:hypothetical protein